MRWTCPGPAAATGHAGDFGKPDRINVAAHVGGEPPAAIEATGFRRGWSQNSRFDRAVGRARSEGSGHHNDNSEQISHACSGSAPRLLGGSDMRVASSGSCQPPRAERRRTRTAAARQSTEQPSARAAGGISTVEPDKFLWCGASRGHAAECHHHKPSPRGQDGPQRSKRASSLPPASVMRQRQMRRAAPAALTMKASARRRTGMKPRSADRTPADAAAALIAPKPSPALNLT